jgi:uncharacterized protein
MGQKLLATVFSSPNLLVQHVLVLALLIAFPVWDHYEIPRLKANTDPEKRVRFYKKIIAAEWACTLVAFFAVGLARLFTIHVLPGEIRWLAGSAGSSFVAGLVTAIAVVILLPAILAIWSEKIRAKAAKASESLSYLLPWNSSERLWWWPVCITAGICEEVLYRGFLLHYLHSTPFHFSLTWSLVIAAAIFGIGHLYQGVKGLFSTAVLGFVLGVIFVMTSSLLIPIIAHAVLDLRILLLIPAGAEPQATAA